MKDKIYTIPVTDAYASECACPLCFLKSEIAEKTVDYYLGPSLMEPDVRTETNKVGFCAEHLSMMYKKEINRLGMGLMLHTHLKDVREDVEEDLAKIAPEPGSFFKGRDKDYKQNLEALADKIEKRSSTCIVCKRIDYTMERYLEVLFWMFFEHPGFREQFEKKSRYCLPHLAVLLRSAGKYLNQKQAAEFLRLLSGLEREGLHQMEGELEWFTLKFDYRNTSKPWGNSKDAVPRGISFLGGEANLENEKK